jgi:tRNA(fMet)-specific endonuclease VapC
MKGDEDAKKAMQGLEEKNDQVGTTIISAYELLKGADMSSKPERNLTKAQDLLSNIEVLNLTLQACRDASVIYREIRKTGTLIGEFDVLIAAIARAHNEIIMTRDGHFSVIRNLKVTSW